MYIDNIAGSAPSHVSAFFPSKTINLKFNIIMSSNEKQIFVTFIF